MTAIFRAAGIFIGSWLIAQIVEALLRSGPGSALARQLGHPELGQPAGATMVASYVRGASGMLLAALFALRSREEEEHVPAAEQTLADRLYWLGDALVAVSSVARVAADFLQERRQIEEIHEASA